MAAANKPPLLGQYAQALFFHEGDFTQSVNQAIAAALEKNPNDVSALSLLGIQAFESENYDASDSVLATRFAKRWRRPR